MTTLTNKATMRRKLANLTQYIDELEKLVKRKTLKNYVDDVELRRAIERLIQIIVESACDCNVLLIVGFGNRPPLDAKDSFNKLASLKIISSDFASELIPLASLRNRLVHEYEQINDKLVYMAINLILKHFKEYTKIITKFLERHN